MPLILIFPSLAEILQSVGSIVRGVRNFTYLGTPAPLWNPQYVDVIVWNTIHLVTCTSLSFLICTISP